MEIKTVTIPRCDKHCGIYKIEVRLYWRCPTCGKPRGEPYMGVSYDGSRRLPVHQWHNECGHVDKYYDVRDEALNNELNEGPQI